MKQPSVLISIDTEAYTLRAKEDHVNRLIWGHIDGKEFGIGRMMDIANKHGMKLSFFLEVAEYTRYNDEIIDVGKEILHRGHDAQLHLHPEMFSPTFINSLNVSKNDLLAFTDVPTSLSARESVKLGKSRWRPELAMLDDIKKYIAASIEIFLKFSHDAPKAIRLMGYKLTPDIIKAMAWSKIPLSCNYNPAFPERASFIQGIRAPFKWPGGQHELPVSCVVRPRGKRVEQYNFNTKWLVDADPHTCAKRHADFLRMFFEDSPDNTVAVLVLHSWSFLQMDEHGYFSIINEKAPEIFDLALGEIKKMANIVTAKEVAEQPQTFFANASELPKSVLANV